MCATYCRVAAVFSQPDRYAEEIHGIMRCVEIIMRDMTHSFNVEGGTQVGCCCVAGDEYLIRRSYPSFCCRVGCKYIMRA